MFAYYDQDLGEHPEAAAMGRRLYAESGLTPDDIDVAMIYENFTPDRVPPARGLRLLRSGRGQRLHRRRPHRSGGSLPVNTNGGLLGEGYIHGMNNIVEGVRQVRGTAANQIYGAEHVLVSAPAAAASSSPPDPRTVVVMTYRGVIYISTDSHVTEPIELYAERVDAEYRDRVPRIETVTAGARCSSRVSTRGSS